jgi:hypothetical protein
MFTVRIARPLTIIFKAVRGKLRVDANIFRRIFATTPMKMCCWTPASVSQLPRRIWLAAGAAYGTGLPVEDIGDADLTLLLAQYGAAILDGVNLARISTSPRGHARTWR